MASATRHVLLVACALCMGAAKANGVVLDDALDDVALPEGLLIGAGVSAVQTEGAWNESGEFVHRLTCRFIQAARKVLHTLLNG